MNTNNMSREQISALADNELADSHIDKTLAALRQPEDAATWDVYHQIGDILRSDEMAIAMRPDFTTRMLVRLESEPVIIAPLFDRQPDLLPGTDKERAINSKFRFKRFTIPGFIAAAAASVALITAPQLMVTMKDGSTQGSEHTLTASTSQASTRSSIIYASASQSTSATPISTSDDGVLRDPHIDEYLRAHQRFSPSLYSSAQFARSTTLARDSEK